MHDSPPAPQLWGSDAPGWHVSLVSQHPAHTDEQSLPPVVPLLEEVLLVDPLSSVVPLLPDPPDNPELLAPPDEASSVGAPVSGETEPDSAVEASTGTGPVPPNETPQPPDTDRELPNQTTATIGPRAPIVRILTTPGP